MAPRRIVFYRTRTGQCPLEEFLDSLPAREAKRIVWLLGLIRDLDKVPENYLKKLKGTGEIWESRIQLGAKAFRVLGFFLGDRFIATNAFVKKSQKTPKPAIEIAERHKRYFDERSKTNG